MKIKNEIFINGVKFVRAEENSNVENTEKKIRDVIKFSNLDWFIINQDEESYTLMLKNKMTPNMIKKHFTQKGMVDSDYDVRYSFTNNNDWKESYIRLVLNTSFIYDLDKENMLKMNDDYVRLATKDEVENMSEEMRKVDDKYGYWTMTPFSSNATSVWRVSTNGDVGASDASNTYSNDGVRPVIRVKR